MLLHFIIVQRQPRVRLQGCSNTAGIAPNEELIRNADFDPRSGYDQMKSLLESQKNFTAVFIASDNVAMGAYAALRESG